MAMTTPPEILIAEPISIPILNILPPSSDTESWSRSPSPRAHRYRSRSREKRKAKAQQEDKSGAKHCDKQKGELQRSPSRASASSSMVCNVDDEEQGNPCVLLLPPSRSWSRSSSLSRRSRWSIRSLLNKDSDCDSSRSVCSLSHLCSQQYFLKRHFFSPTLDAQRDIPVHAKQSDFFRIGFF